MIALIAAVAKNGVIGHQGKMPWHLSDDLKRFKEITMGKPIIMGRRTFESIGRPLLGRKNIVITRNAAYTAPGCEVVGSFDDAIERAGKGDVFVIGGGEVYGEAIRRAKKIYLTEVDAGHEGDAFFPAFDRTEWKEVSREKGEGEPAHEFVILERIEI